MCKRVTADNEENIGKKNAANKSKAALQSVVEALFNNGKHNGSDGYGQQQAQGYSFNKCVKHGLQNTKYRIGISFTDINPA